MIGHAWRGYSLGYNELRPISGEGYSARIFGRTKLGATVVDSLDTLYIAGLMEEYKQARDWVENSLNFDQVRWDVGGVRGCGFEYLFVAGMTKIS